MTRAPSRRGLLAAGMLLPVLPASGAPNASPAAAATTAIAAPDRRLVQLRATALDAFARYEAAVAVYSAAEQVDDAAQEAAAGALMEGAWSDYESALVEMAETPAAGLVGLAAKLTGSHAFAEINGGQNDAEFLMLASAAEDAARMLGDMELPELPWPEAALPDAELLRLYDEWYGIGQQQRTAVASLQELDGKPFYHPAVQALFEEEGRLRGERRRVVAAIAELPGLTRTGRESKAEILGAYARGGDDPTSLLAASLVADLLE